MNPENFHLAQAQAAILSSVNPSDPFFPVYASLIAPTRHTAAEEFLKARHSSNNLDAMNHVAREFRNNYGKIKGKNFNEITKGIPKEISKAQLDVGTLTNFASITGGQSLGYVSLDTQVARGTVRPSSFTLYQALKKSHAYQVVDYWNFASDTGGPLPGAAFSSFSGVGSGTLSTSAGVYSLQNITLKLAVNGRAITTALASQNSFVDIAAQENANAALDVLSTLNWACYWGSPTFFANQFLGLASAIPTANQVDFQAWSNSYAAAQGWSPAQALFNLIYQWSAQITGQSQFGRITHAFMSPTAVGSLQGLVTTVMNNVVTDLTQLHATHRGITVNGDLQGMLTRFGEIQFPIDLFITYRDKPAQAILKSDGTNFATTSAPTKPASVSVAVSGGADPNSKFTAAYVANSGWYQYAVASCDASMNESTLTFATQTSGVTTTITNVVTITGPVVADAVAFRVYRSGLLGASLSVSANPAAFRFIGTVTAAGSGAVTFADQNAKIPGSETVFLLDMDEEDNAIDYRFLLPLTKIELFAQNLYMPWAVASIGSIRVRVPKFHGMILNYVGDNADWNPLATNSTVV